MYVSSNVATCEQIQSACEEIQPFLEAFYDADNPQAVIDRANHLEGYMALSGKMYADAKFRRDEVLNGIFIAEIKKALNAGMAVSLTNKYIDTTVRDYQHLVDWTDRINRACTHQLDMCRSVLSKLKEELKQVNYGR